MNELANLAEKLGADIEHVRQGIGSDARIGYHFLYAGCGYGGACFPKDVSALQQTAREAGMELRILDAVNTGQPGAEIAAARKNHAPLRRRSRRQALCRVGARVQAQYRRHARGAEPDHRAGPRRARRHRGRVRSGRDGAGETRVRGACRHRLRDFAAGGARRRRLPGDRHRVEGIPQPRFRRHQAPAQHAGDHRRPQPLRARDGAQLRPRVFRHRESVKRADRGVGVTSEVGRTS